LTSTHNNDSALIIIVSIFIGGMTISSVLASKIITLFGLLVPAGVLAYSVTFICTDVVSEIWGKQRAKQMVIGGFISLIVVLILVQVARVWPKAPIWHGEAGFQAVLGSTSRIIVASFIAYLVSQFHDVYVFHFLKRITQGRHLWLRNNLSTAISQFIDSVLFITIAFYGTMPVWPLIMGQWVVKLAIALLDTPVFYFAVWMLHQRTGAPPEQVPDPVV